MATRKQLAVTLHVDELIYDIKNKARLTSLSREAEGQANYEAVAKMQISDDDEILSQIQRSLCANYGSLLNNLSEYIDGDTTVASNNQIMDNLESANGSLVITFSLPSNYNSSLADSISQNAHSYLVNMCVGDWFSITNKADVNQHYEHAKLDLDNVKRALCARVRPVRPTHA